MKKLVNHASLLEKGKSVVSMYNRSGKLYLKYKLHGNVIRKSTGFPDTPENRETIKKKLLPKLEAKIVLGQLNNPNKAKSFEYYAEQYLKQNEGQKSYRTIKLRANQALRFFKTKKIDIIKRSDINEFAFLLLENSSVKTVKNTLSVVSGIFNLAVDSEVIPKNICKNIKLPKHVVKRPEPFTHEQVYEILNAIQEDWFKCFVGIAFFTGMRTGEIIGLKIEDLDLENKILTVKRNVVEGVVTTPKTIYSMRDVPIFDDLYPYLIKQIGTRTSGFLFVTPKGDHYYGAEVISAQRWRKVLDELGIEYRRLYTTRHTFISSALKSGALSVLDITRIVGHANPSTLLRVYSRYIEGEQLKISRSFNPFNKTSKGG